MLKNLIKGIFLMLTIFLLCAVLEKYSYFILAFREPYACFRNGRVAFSWLSVHERHSYYFFFCAMHRLRGIEWNRKTFDVP
jgi:hypothetical protein